MRNLEQIKNLKGKIALVRVDFNVPIQNGEVKDDFRIRAALPTINFLLAGEAKIILISHLGKGGESLAPAAGALNKFLKVKFISEITGSKVEKEVFGMKNGDVLLLENLRNDEGEQNCDEVFASKLAKLGDIYVNEAFPESHRKVASIVILPKLLPGYVGFQFEKEVENLSHAFKNPKHPFLFILGGAKFSTKMPLIERYLELADHIFVGGALANDFLKAEGYDVGKSLVSDSNFGIEKLLKNKKLVLPVDFVKKEEIILDIGGKTIKELGKLIQESQLILWNGPLGIYEDGGAEATKKVLQLVAASRAESIIGGGDTVALVSQMKMQDKFSFVSTGGGATLDFLANGTLLGIKALE